MEKKQRILCLHGYGQSKTAFEEQTMKFLGKELGQVAELGIDYVFLY